MTISQPPSVLATDNVAPAFVPERIGPTHEQGRTLTLYGDPVLREKCQPVTEINDDLRGLAIDMARLLREHNGVGFAAPQCGEALQMFIFDKGDGVIHCCINPRVQHRSGIKRVSEGCLSLPGAFATVPAPLNMDIEYYELDGTLQRTTATGFGAQIINHEMSHLDGRLFIDRIPTRTERQLVIKKARLPK